MLMLDDGGAALDADGGAVYRMTMSQVQVLMATRTGMPGWRNNRWEARTRSQSSPALCCLPVFIPPPYPPPPPLLFTCSHSAADTEDKHLRCLYTGSSSSLLVTLFTLAETNRAESAASVAWTNSSARAVRTSVKRGSGTGQGAGFVHGWMYQLSRSRCGCPHGCRPRVEELCLPWRRPLPSSLCRALQ